MATPDPIDFRKPRKGAIECRFMGATFPSAQNPQAHRGDVIWIDAEEQKRNPKMFVPVSEERAKQEKAARAAEDRNAAHMARRAQFAASAEDSTRAAALQAQREADAAITRAAALEAAAGKPKQS